MGGRRVACSKCGRLFESRGMTICPFCMFIEHQPSIKAGARVAGKAAARAHQAVHRVPAEEHTARMRDHEIIVELGNNRKLMAALRELDESPRALAEAVEDGSGFLKRRRVKLPAGTTITFKKRAKGWEMDVLVDEPPHVYHHRYNSEKGLIHR